MKEEKINPKTQIIYGLGRRKTAIARVKITPGSGKFIINNKPIATPSRIYTEVLKKANQDGKIDVTAVTQGGGIRSQIEAIRLAIARAMVKMDPEIKKTLKVEGFLTRDPRMKERKKPGLKGARRAPQWQKR